MTINIRRDDGTWVRLGNDVPVWVVITLNPCLPGGRMAITDLEILNHPPQWDLAELNQVCYQGNVNGGDSVPWGVTRQ